jgi:hypothetical protein
MFCKILNLVRHSILLCTLKMEPITETKPGFFENFGQKWQYILDKSSPHVLYRWLMLSVAMSLYILRVYYVNGWFIVTYGLGIYLLNQVIGFMSPQVIYIRSCCNVI